MTSRRKTISTPSLKSSVTNSGSESSGCRFTAESIDSDQVADNIERVINAAIDVKEVCVHFCNKRIHIQIRE
jgi:hypothetical protein